MTDHFHMGALPPQNIERLIAKMGQFPLRAGAPWPSDLMFVPSGRPLPSSVNMMSVCPPVEDQLQYGTCTANSTVGICEMILKAYGRFTPGVDDLSRMFNYWMAGTLENSAGQDTGRTLRSSVIAAQLYGLCKESTEPYTGSDLTTAPSDAAKAEAALHRAATPYYILPDANQDFQVTCLRLKQALADGYAVSMGFHVFRWLFNVSGPMSTHASQPGPLNPGDHLLDFVGNHDVVIVGYQDGATMGGVTDGYFIVRNSWGTSWGDGGYWAMPYVLVNNAFEFWTLSGFDGLGQVIEPPLTDAAKHTLQQDLVNKGFGVFNADGTFTWAPLPIVHQALTAAMLTRANLSHQHMGEVVGLPTSDVDTFLANPANAAYVTAWLGALK